jgi:hypothetical protein
LKTSSLGAYLTISDTQPSVTLKGHMTTVKSKMKAGKWLSVYLNRNFVKTKLSKSKFSFTHKMAHETTGALSNSLKMR